MNLGQSQVEECDQFRSTVAFQHDGTGGERVLTNRISLQANRIVERR